MTGIGREERMDVERHLGPYHSYYMNKMIAAVLIRGLINLFRHFNHHD